jgi:hypothetical protein
MKSMKQLLAEQAERDNTNRITRHLALLHQYQNHLIPDDLVRLFGESVGFHLWEKCKVYDYNLLDFYNQLSKANAEILANDIAAYERKSQGGDE